MTIRNLKGLTDEMQMLATMFDAACEAHGLDVLIYCTRRTNAEQAKLYRQGRALWEIEARANDLRSLYGRPDLADILIGVGPQSGKRVITWSGPGQSMHNYGLAFDGVPLLHGKPVWDNEDDEDRKLWSLYGRLAVECGLEWAGNWSAGKREMPHCQMRGIDWRSIIKSAV